MTTKITPEMIDALNTLREFAQSSTHNSLNTLSRDTAEAINTIDDAGIFAAIDEETGYDIDPGISTQSAMDGKIYRSDGSVLPAPLDPAEWGDTTRADMARHQKDTNA
jgi:hypothetical protein